MLFSYMQRAQLLLDDQGIALYNPADLITYINLGRQQIATECECVRDLGTLSLTGYTQSYSFGLISLPSGQGYNSVLNVRLAAYSNSSGYKQYMTERPWEWFFRYYLSPGTSPATSSTPNIWSVLGRGTLGTIYVYPTPTGYETLTLDTVILPNNLVLDTDTEALAYPFTDAVPFYAAYYAAFTSGNVEAAKMFWEQYTEYVSLASEGATPTTLVRESPGFAGARLARNATTRDGVQGDNG